MRFLLTYRERRADPDPGAARRRVARLLDERVQPPGVEIRELLSRIGRGGGYAVVETTEADGLQQVAALFSGFDCTIEPVSDVMADGRARAAELPAAAGRQALPEMPAFEPHEGAFSDDDVYDTED